MMAFEHLFVYGSLRRLPNGNLHPFLQNHARYIDRVCVYGLLYEIDNYPGLVLDPNHQFVVYGELYQLAADSTALWQCLDAYEECTPGFPQPHEYTRRLVKVHRQHHGDINAWVYLYNRPTLGLRQIVGSEYSHTQVDKLCENLAQ